MKYSLNCQTLPSECTTSTTMAKKLKKVVSKLLTNQVRNAGRWDKELEARLHVSTLAFEHLSTQNTLARKHTRHVGTWARKHARHVGTWARKARNLADSWKRWPIHKKFNLEIKQMFQRKWEIYEKIQDQ